MDEILYPWWLASQAVSVMFHYWQVTLPLVVGLVLALVIRLPFLGSGRNPERRHFLLLSPLAVAFLILLWGAVMEHPGTSGSRTTDWPSHVILALLVVQVLVSLWVVRGLNGYRWFAVFAVALELWFGVACVFVATMSVTGNWL